MNKPELLEVKIVETETNIEVIPVWKGVDRPVCFSWGLKKSHMSLAKRLQKACLAGVVLVNPQIKTDIYGKTYVETNCRVLGRMLNADLKRLGF